MATSNSAVIGLLRVLLSANTAEFDAAMQRSANTAQAWSRDLRAVGQQATQVGAALTKTLTVPIAGVGLAAAKLAIDFESSFAGVRKTVDGTEPQLEELAQGFRDLSKTIPVNVNDLNRLGEAAGALGIPRDKIVEFAAVMAKLGVSTNLTADQAADAIARIQNIFGAAGRDTENLASTLVALGNAGASTEREIVEMAQRIAGAGHTVGLTQAQVLAFASTLASVGINAEAGGSAISRVFLKINDAVQKGGGGLAEFARVAGMTSAQFRQAFETDAARATQSFIEGLGRLKASGENINATIEGLTGKNIILKDTLFRLSGAGGLLNDQLKIADTAWKSNTALTKEAAERFKTTESRLILLGNRVKDVGITLGNALGPAIDAAIRGVNLLIPVLETMAHTFGALPGSVQLTIVAFAGVVAAIGPVIYVVGQLTLAMSALTGAFAAKGIATRFLVADLAVLTTALRANVVAAAANVTTYGAMGAASIAVTAATRALGAAIMAMPWAAAAAGIAAITGALVSYRVAAANARLETETAGAKQDVINKALAQGAARNAEYAAAADKYAAAIAFNSRLEAIRIAQFDRSTEAQQRAIEAHLALGHITQQEATNSIAALTGTKAATKAVVDETKELTKEGKKHVELLKEIRAASVPLTAAQEAEVISLDKLGISHSKIAQFLGVSVTRVDALTESLEEQGKALKETAEIWERFHEGISDSSHKFITEWIADTTAAGRKVADASAKALADQYLSSQDYQEKSYQLTLTGTDLKVRQIERERDAQILAHGDMGGATSRYYQQQIELEKTRAHDVGDALDDLSQGFAQLATISGGSLGGVVQGLGQVVGALSLATEGMETFNEASAASDFAGMASGIMGVVSAGVELGHLFSKLTATEKHPGGWLGLRSGWLGDAVGTNTIGRQATQAFADANGGWDALHAKMLATIPDAEKLWKVLTQTVSNADPVAAKAAIKAIEDAIAASPATLAGAAGYQTKAELQAVADKAREVYEYMAASGQYTATQIADAFQKSKDAQIAALGETEAAQDASLDAITAKYAEALGKLDAEYKSLSESVAKEAEEEVMGLTEMRERERMQQIEDEKAAILAQQAFEIDAKNETFDAMLTAGQRIDLELRTIFGIPLEIPYRFTAQNLPNLPSGGAIPAGALDTGLQASATAGSQSTFTAGPTRESGGTMAVHVNLDGRTAAKAVVPYIPGRLAVIGVGR